MLVRGVAFQLTEELPSEARLLLSDFRLAANEAIRAGLTGRVSSRYAIAKLAYRTLREDHPMMYAQHVVSSIEVAASALKNHRRQMKGGKQGRVPFVKRLMMKAENQAYKLDRVEGIIDFPIGAGCHVKLRLVVSRYHRRYLDDPDLSLGSLTVLQNRVVVAFRKETPRPRDTTSVIALDTNESSIDGVFVRSDEEAGPITVRAQFMEAAAIQRRHHDRQKRLQKKKAHDRRVGRILCKREGKREHDRVSYRIHQVANAVVKFAEDRDSAVVLEDLDGMRPSWDKNLNRRLSLWPRRRLHHCIEYKAAWKGIPVMKVDPRYSSRKCPICGRINYSRMDTRDREFKCECGWHLDRHINASLNLLQTAISKGLEVAGGLRFNPGAFQHDVMMTLYEPAMAARSEPNGTSHVTAVT